VLKSPLAVIARRNNEAISSFIEWNTEIASSRRTLSLAM